MFKALMKWMQANKILPQISDTERQALEAGSVWIDGQFFAGRADFAKVLAEPYGQLSAEEQRSEEHTSELQSLMRISYAVFCLKKKKNNQKHNNTQHTITHKKQPNRYK